MKLVASVVTFYCGSLLSLLFTTGVCFAVQSERTIFFRAKPASVPFLQTLPPNTQIYTTWPKTEFRIDLPDSIPAVAVHEDGHNYTLMGPPIHVQSGDRLKLTLKNDIPYTGLSIHLHGLNLGGAVEYDGAVGVSQCPLAEGNTYVYDVVVDDSPGTYWYHTSSGYLGVDAYDAIRGPLIVHPSGSEDLVDLMNAPSLLPSGYSTIAYENERILFFQDGFLSPGKLRYSNLVGNLAPPPSKSDEGIIVATSPWQFGTCNGKLRDVIHVAANQKYKFRVVNGGQHHALQFRIDGFPLTVVAADSQPVEAYTVDEIVLHVGERFDVEVSVFNDVQEGERFWIRADTLESRSQGFQHGIRAIMRVSDPKSVHPRGEDVPDPTRSIVTPVSTNTKTLNCHALSSGCVPITSLSPLSIKHAVDEDNVESEIHTVDTHFQLAPQYGHFVSIDSSAMTQNELPPAAMISRTFRPDQSTHPNTMALRVARSSPVIIVWRTSLLMDVPIHLHGHSVEILDVAHPVLSQDCNTQSCSLSRAYESEEKLQALDKTPPNHAVRKDTFVIPAGGAIVTRIHTGSRGIWLVNGQKDTHNEDGLSFVLIVGDYQIPRVDDWPQDFPTCNSTLVKSMTLEPDCECYIDKDAPFQLETPDKKFCSRAHLCRHKFSHAANLDSYVYDWGFNIQSGWDGIPDIITAVVFCSVVAASVMLLVALPSIRSRSNMLQSNYGSNVVRRLSSLGIGSRLPQRVSARRSNIDINMSSSRESQSMIGMSRVESTEHIGTITLPDDFYEGEREDSDYFDDDTPPPPSTLSQREYHAEHNTSDDEESKSAHSSPPPTPRRKNSQPSTACDTLLNRQSTLSTFERIFCERDNDLNDAFDFLLDGYSVTGTVEITPVDDKIVHKGSSFWRQLFYLVPIQWHAYFPSCVNLLRVVEVAGLAFVTGAVFRSAGGGNESNSQATVAELSSLVIVLTTTWTFSRLFSSISSHHDWFKSIQVIFRYRRFSLAPVVMARTTVVMLCESAWAIVATVICFPAATLVGDFRSLCNIAFLLTSNNMCYISLGSLLGTFDVSYGMIAGTIFSQISILTAGIFTELPPAIAWARYASPFYWTVRGLIKSVYRRSDTYDCVNGSSSEIGANQCFVEYDPLVEQYRRRGFHIGTSSDDDPSNVFVESAALVVLTLGIQMLVFGRCFFVYYKVNWGEMKGSVSLR